MSAISSGGRCVAAAPSSVSGFWSNEKMKYDFGLTRAVEVVGQRRVVERHPGAEQVLLQHRLRRDLRIARDQLLEQARCACRRLRSRRGTYLSTRGSEGGLYENFTETVGRPFGPSATVAGVVLRRVLIGALLAVIAAAFAAPALAATQVLMPNVSYKRTVQFTAHGPVVLNVITAPRPGGLYQLKPLLSNGTIVGTERVTSMQKDISDSATVAGVNGDLFNFNDGHPSGMLMQDGVLQSPPYRFRSSVGISLDGAPVRRPRRVLRLLAGARAAPAADGPEPASARRRHLALHAGLGPVDAEARRRGRGGHPARSRRPSPART